ncbi:MAG: RICIN domain-containing protein [Fibrobacteres bacterium]|nr:RICIN domain-containing protein [Fibrobacterota bacterium]
MSFASGSLVRMVVPALALWGTSQACREPVVPGGDWKDNRGKVVSATEGGIIQVDGTYYHWGMDRSADNSYFVGINLYSSKDLVHWTFVNQILRHDSDPLLDNKATVERAKILHNKKTGQFVIWMHYEGHNAYSVAEVAWATSNKIDGDYKFQGHFRPLDLDSRDLNVYQDADGKAYLICTTKGNQNVSLFELDDTYTKVVREIYRGNASDDMECEGHAIVKSGGMYYWLMSWCTGWDFNDNRYFTSKTLAGPWSAGKTLGVGGTHTYESQVGWAFPMPGDNGTDFVFMGDRWSINDFASSRTVMLPFSISNGAVSMPWMDRWYPNTDSGWVRGEPYFQSGVYTIGSKATGKVLAVPSKTSAAAIALVTDSGTVAQRWKLESLGNSEYRFTSVHSGLRMDVSDESREAGAKVIQYTASEKWNQKWHLISSAPGAWRMISENTLGKIMEVPTATPNGIALGIYKGKANQEWEIVPVSPLADGKWYSFRASHSGKALTSTSGGMVQWTDSAKATQAWKARKLANGEWALEQDGKRLSVVGEAVTDGADLVVASDTGSGSRWKIVDDGTGTLQIVNGCSGKSLDVDGGEKSLADGAKVMPYRYWDTKNQTWTAKEVPAPISALAPTEKNTGFRLEGRRLVVEAGLASSARYEVRSASGELLVIVPASAAVELPGHLHGVVSIRMLPVGGRLTAVLP